ncbi:hypothetical protein FLGSB24_11400 [Flavobacterium sp. GSB-24]|nr:hypothetical protein FLGSB24_11400 [Flavobacterium sp. GSB-24]
MIELAIGGSGVLGGVTTGGVVVIGADSSDELQLIRNTESIMVTICLKYGFIICLNLNLEVVLNK